MTVVFAGKGHESMHAIGVQPIHSVDDLIEVITKHQKEKGERFCPLFADIRLNMRVPRWVALHPNGKGFLVHVLPGDIPRFVTKEELLDTTFLGRYMRAGRLFYDALNLELPQLKAMQRLS